MFLLLAALLNAPCNIHPVYVLQPKVGPVKVRREDGSYHASAPVSYEVREKTPALIRSMSPGLLDHVRGHQIIAQRVARSSAGVVDAIGSSAAQARSRLKDGIARSSSDDSKELMREERVYDAVTENGAAQSQGPMYGFPGGPDVDDPCAH